MDPVVDGMETESVETVSPQELPESPADVSEIRPSGWKIDLSRMAHIIKERAGSWGGRIRRNPAAAVSGLGVAVLLAVVVFLAVSAADEHRGNQRLYAQISSLDQNIELISKEREQWTSEKRALTDDPFYTELLLLQKNMVKPGEKVLKPRR